MASELLTDYVLIINKMQIKIRYHFYKRDTISHPKEWIMDKTKNSENDGEDLRIIGTNPLCW